MTQITPVSVSSIETKVKKPLAIKIVSLLGQDMFALTRKTAYLCAKNARPFSKKAARLVSQTFLLAINFSVVFAPAACSIAISLTIAETGLTIVSLFIGLLWFLPYVIHMAELNPYDTKGRCYFWHNEIIRQAYLRFASYANLINRAKL